MNSHFITYQHSVIHYRYSGEGPESVICFHGFGTFARTFDWLAAHVPGHRFIAFDLPGHGDTQWNDGNTFTPKQLLEIIDLCPHVGGDRFSLLGYSMGGRISLQLLQLVPHRVAELVLLAPDGLHLNPWYWFSTQTAVGNRFFKYVMTKPHGFVSTLHRASQYNLINKGILKFVERYMEDRHVRELVYSVWTMFRRFKPDLGRVTREINGRNIPVVLIYGKYDSIIPLDPGEKFFHGITGRKRMEILETGHQILHVRNAPYIADAFNLPW